MKKYGALEAGGTKMVLSILNAGGEMLERKSIPTRSPMETMPEMIEFFREHGIAALGIGCFGPLELNPSAPTYGYITQTPKLAWRDYPILPEFQHALNVPVGMDTDVNAAALAEIRLGAARGLGSCLYITVGTGIGGGLVINGKCVHGLVHPELGHQLLVPHPQDPTPDGFCPSHRHCLEGLASGPAMEQRWGMSARELPPNHRAWEIEAYYLAQMCHNAIMHFSPEKIILGGGVMQVGFLAEQIRKKTFTLLNGYIRHPAISDELRELISTPGLGVHSGVMGAWLLALEAASE